MEIYPNHKVIGKRPSAEFLFAGSQRLTALRDAFNCVADFMVYGCHDEEEGGDDEIVETMTTGAEVVAEDEAVEGGEPVEVQFNRVGQSLSRSGGQDDTLADTGVTVIRRRRNPRKQQGLAMATTKTTSASSSISLQPTNAVSAAHQKEEEEDIIIPTKRRRGRPKKIKETTHNSNVPVAIGIEPLLPPSQTTTTTTTTTARKKPPASIFISSQETNDPHQQQPYVDLDFLKSNAVRNTHSRKTSASCLAIERVLYDDTRDAGVERYST